MKKYLLAITAVLLAFGFSAFNSVKKPVDSPQSTTYFWYPVSGGLLSGPKLNTTKVDKTAAMADVTITTCQDQNSSLCVAGSSASNLGSGDNIPAPAGDNYINHNN